MSGKKAERHETVYSRSDLLAAADSFGVRPYVMAGALRLVGRDSMTRREAEAAIKKYQERRV